MGGTIAQAMKVGKYADRVGDSAAPASRSHPSRWAR